MTQFAIVVVAFILMTGFMLQIRHIQTADLGFPRDNLMLVRSMDSVTVTPAQIDTFLAAARALPAVRRVTIGDDAPGPTSSPGGNSQIIRPGQATGVLLGVHSVSVVGPDYFQAVGTRLLAGRLFDLHRAEDRMWTGPGDSRVFSVIVSRRLARDMGFASPAAAVDQTARFGDRGGVPVRIVGVVDDMRFTSPTETIPAKLYLVNPNARGLGIVRYQGMSEGAMRGALGKLWRQIIPDVPFDAVTAAANLDTYYKPERDRSHLFTIGTGIAALIGCIGLYGMAAFNAGRRVHEIGMRKVLGASRGQVIRLLLVQFLRPVVVASLLAWPLAWVILQRWLAQFDDVIEMPLWLFPSASGVALVIALATVAGVAFTAASAEPAKALRQS
jgi:putative ABC transport system permease protein